MLTGPNLSTLLTSAGAISATAIASIGFGFGFLPALGIGAATAATGYVAKKSYSLMNQLDLFLTRLNGRVLPRAENAYDANARLWASLNARVEELRHLTQLARHVDAVGRDIETISREFTQIIQRASQFINAQADANPELNRSFQEFLQNVNGLMGSLNVLLAGLAPARGLGLPIGLGAGNPFAMFGGPAGGNPFAAFGGGAGGNPLAALFAGLARGEDSDDENPAPRDPDARAEDAMPAENPAPEERAEGAHPANPAPAERVVEEANALEARKELQVRENEATHAEEAAPLATHVPERRGTPAPLAEENKDAPSENTELSARKGRRRR